MNQLQTSITLLKKANKRGGQVIMERRGDRVTLSDTYHILDIPAATLTAKDWDNLAAIFGPVEPGEAVRIMAKQRHAVPAFLAKYLERYEAEGIAPVKGPNHEKPGQYINQRTGQDVVRLDVQDLSKGQLFIAGYFVPLLDGIMTTKPDSKGTPENERVKVSAVYIEYPGQDARAVVLPVRYFENPDDVLALVNNYQANIALNEYGPVLFTIKTKDNQGKRSTFTTRNPLNYNIRNGSIWAPESATKTGGDPYKLVRVETIHAGVPNGSDKYAELLKRQLLEAVQTWAAQEQKAAARHKFERELQAQGVTSERVGVYSI